MSKSNPTSPPSQAAAAAAAASSSWPTTQTLIFLFFLVPVSLGLLVYQLDSFDAAPLPFPESSSRPASPAPLKNDRVLRGAEFVGSGKLVGPEDIAYDANARVMYTTCVDGWIKRVNVNDSVVHDWVNTGGRPLGVALGPNGEVIVADAYKGLLRIRSEGEIELLTDEAEGVKFKLTDGVDIAKDGTIYFTDASYKYSFSDFIWDILEGKPHGRLMSFDPVTRTTQVLVRDLYFANGVAVSPDQHFVVFCETPLARCRKHYIQGEKKGATENFGDKLFGAPDNIRYDGHGHFLIAFSTEITFLWDMVLRYPVVRKMFAIVTKHFGMLHAYKNGGVLVVDVEGNPVAHYYDPKLTLISSGAIIGDHLYMGSIGYPHIVRLDLSKHPALPPLA